MRSRARTNDFIIGDADPIVTSQVFAIFNCRAIGPSFAVLVADYTVECYTTSYNLLFGIAVVIGVLFTLGVPLWTGWRLTRPKMLDAGTPEHKCAMDALAQQLNCDVTLAENMLQELRYVEKVSTLTSAYRGRYGFWEAVDMMRKFLLVGAGVFIEPGTMLQLSFVGFVACTFMMLQVWLQPYRRVEDNLQHVGCEIAIFVNICVIVFLKATEDAYESGSQARPYYTIVNASVLVLVVVPFACSLCMKSLRIRAQACIQHQKALPAWLTRVLLRTSIYTRRGLSAQEVYELTQQRSDTTDLRKIAVLAYEIGADGEETRGTLLEFIVTAMEPAADPAMVALENDNSIYSQGIYSQDRGTNRLTSYTRVKKEDQRAQASPSTPRQSNS